MLRRKGFSLIGISLAPRASFLPNACGGLTDAFSRPSVVRVGSFTIPAVYTSSNVAGTLRYRPSAPPGVPLSGNVNVRSASAPQIHPCPCPLCSYTPRKSTLTGCDEFGMNLGMASRRMPFAFRQGHLQNRGRIRYVVPAALTARGIRRVEVGGTLPCILK